MRITHASETVSRLKSHSRRRTRLLASSTLALALAFVTTNAVAADTKMATECPTARELSVTDVPEGTSATKCGLVGRILRADGVGVAIPEPGTGVSVAAISTTGETPELQVAVAADGTITYGKDSGATGTPSDESGTTGTSASALSACTDTANSTESWTEWGTYNWYVGDGGMPAGMSQSQAATSFADAINNITGSYNDCGLADEVGASASYQGTTTYEADIDSSGNCTAYDDRSTWDAGDLPSTTVAIACSFYWAVTYDLFEADVRFNTTDFDFTNDVTVGCLAEYDVRSVGTHEAGHVFGLGHVPVDITHAELTMYPSSFLCSEEARTLGYGDVLGLRKKY
ncbi:hypothetical protein QFZ82_007385 [Streptomyces sp. V4I23]|nr:hypothetical protein [Streptomyces sp. V4I23]